MIAHLISILLYIMALRDWKLRNARRRTVIRDKQKGSRALQSACTSGKDQ